MTTLFRAAVLLLLLAAAAVGVCRLADRVEIRGWASQWK